MITLNSCRLTYIYYIHFNIYYARGHGDKATLRGWGCVAHVLKHVARGLVLVLLVVFPLLWD